MRPRFTKGHQDIIVCAVRYALGRQTYIVGTVTDYVRDNVSMLDGHTLDIITTSIERERYYGKGLGSMTIDEPQWLRLLDIIEEERCKRVPV
jgi:hypothetical protein